MKIFNILKQLDLFGAQLFQRVDQDSQIYKSIFGGIISLLIFSSSLAYAFWEFYRWNTYQLNPKISTSLYASDFSLLDQNYGIIKINYWKDNIDAIDPFEKRILIPMISYTENYIVVDTQILKFSNETSYNGNQFLIPQMKLGFSQINGSLMTTSEMYIYFVKCSEELLSEDEKCASQDIIDDFFKQPLNTIVMQIHYNQLNSKDASIQQSVQEFLIQVEKESCYTLNTYLQTTYYDVRNSFLFGQPNYYEFVNGVQIQPQTNSVSYCKQAFGYETYSVIYIQMKGNQVKTILEYPTVGDILANIGSIVSVLFMARFIINSMNSYFLHQQVIRDLISFYYPQFQDIKIIRNWKFQIKKVQLKNEVIDSKEFQEFYRNIKSQMELKMTLSNIIYEISRLYLLVRSNKLREEIERCHQIGISFNSIYLQSNELETSLKSTARKSEWLYLNNQDVNLLSLSRRKQQRLDSIDNEIPIEENDFYGLNKVYS
ncbi:unnamed protein product (macronuclear) [Paramecium tetraurelia]|uniref:Transmembrane protein n=1 Tax=Paramecium tetraurelia TaxID=5888 RepID=A0EAS2_PARTE|nr:uncharacterized protein GSPATT00025123001 [Paramecium tetraurelia]CAK92389.1 unnamed protein product [Paramecium tetraurelia]|eukprot:XP_001459786.1 hypothetical protein (macronuclear) [Paramecium tetraurelia strain d4-2]